MFSKIASSVHSQVNCHTLKLFWGVSERWNFPDIFSYGFAFVYYHEFPVDKIYFLFFIKWLGASDVIHFEAKSSHVLSEIHWQVLSVLISIKYFCKWPWGKMCLSKAYSIFLCTCHNKKSAWYNSFYGLDKCPEIFYLFRNLVLYCSAMMVGILKL